MLVQFYKAGVCDVPQIRLVEALLDLGLTVSLSEFLVTVEVSEFVEFLRAYYRSCAKMSRSEEGLFLLIKLKVKVLYRERWYETMVWFDSDAKGVRYGSLS